MFCFHEIIVLIIKCVLWILEFCPWWLLIIAFSFLLSLFIFVFFFLLIISLLLGSPFFIQLWSKTHPSMTRILVCKTFFLSWSFSFGLYHHFMYLSSVFIFQLIFMHFSLFYILCLLLIIVLINLTSLSWDM